MDQVSQSQARRAAQQRPSPVGRPRTGRRLLIPLGLLGLTLIVLSYYLPSVLVASGYLSHRIRRWVGTDQIQVGIERIELSWLGPVQLHTVKIATGEGHPVASVPQLRTRESLLALLWNGAEAVTLELDRPTVQVQMRPGGSNVEDVIWAWLAHRPATKRRITVQLTVRQGTIEVQARPSDVPWRLNSVNLRSYVDAGATLVVRSELAADIESRDDSGHVSGKLDCRVAPDAPPELDGQLDFDHVPLQLARSLGIRFGKTLDLSGKTSGRVTLHAPPLRVEANAQATQLRMSGPWLAAGDQFTSSQLALDLAVARAEDSSYHVERCAITSQIGELRLSGSLTAGLVLDVRGGHADAWTILSQVMPLESSGTLDVARVAKMLPDTLHIRDDTVLTSGQVSWQVYRDVEGARGQIVVQDIRGSHNGRDVHWTEPTEAVFQLTRGTLGWAVNQLTCRSPFCRLSAAGSLVQGRVFGNCDLDRLGRDLSQILDLGGFEMAGDVQLDANWTVALDRRLRAKADLVAHNLQLGTPRRGTWTEPSIHVAASVDGVAAQEGFQLQSASTRLAAAGDTISVSLTERVSRPSWDTPWPVQVQLAGELSRWASRWAWIGPARRPNIAGWITASTRGTISRRSAQIDDGQVQLWPAARSDQAPGNRSPALQARVTGEFEFPTQQSATLRLRPGLIVDSMRLTPEVCRTWLKYVAPLLADLTDVQGSFSLYFDRANLQWVRPETSDASGKLIIHGARVSPGPLARQVMLIASQLRDRPRTNVLDALLPTDVDWLELPEQEIAFDVRDGRVYHRGLVVEIGDVPVRSHGFVAFDQSLRAELRIEVDPSWVDGRPLLAGLAGQTIRIPLQGTLSRPEVERGALRQLGRQTLRSAAEGLLDQQLERLLEGDRRRGR